MKTKFTSHRAAIKAAMKQQDVKIADVCRVLKYSPANFSSFLSGKRTIPADLLEQVMEILKIKLVVES